VTRQSTPISKRRMANSDHRYLREMIYNHPEISKLFKDETIHVLDYDFEYDQGFPCEKEFPEFSNKMFRTFNSDTSMCTGRFVFGDVDSGATMTLNVRPSDAVQDHADCRQVQISGRRAVLLL
jgi:hypothetical protein